METTRPARPTSTTSETPSWTREGATCTSFATRPRRAPRPSPSSSCLAGLRGASTRRRRATVRSDEPVTDGGAQSPSVRKSRRAPRALSDIPLPRHVRLPGHGPSGTAGRRPGAGAAVRAARLRDGRANPPRAAGALRPGRRLRAGGRALHPGAGRPRDGRRPPAALQPGSVGAAHRAGDRPRRKTPRSRPGAHPRRGGHRPGGGLREALRAHQPPPAGVASVLPEPRVRGHAPHLRPPAPHRRAAVRRPDPSPLAAHWTLDPDVTFLDHGAFGACPREVLALQTELRARMERDPLDFLVCALEPLLYEARGRLAAFLHADPDCFFFVDTATAGVNTVLRSLDFHPGDELLTTDHGYNACLNALNAVASRSGARVVIARVPFPVRGPEEVQDAVLSAVTARTRLVLLDHVTSATGVVFPVEALVPAIQGRGIDVLVDGAHAPGMVPVDVEALGAAY